MWGVALGAGSLLAFSVSPAAAKPCEKHQGEAKQACLKKKHERDARDKMAWPPRPSDAEIRERVGEYNWAKAYRVAQCETGRNVRWYITASGTPTGTYVTALGMYVQTYAFGARATGYRGRTWAEQVAIAVAAHPITRGWSGWGCGGA